MAGVREQDQYMPIANVIRIMRRILPAHAKISDDAKETIQECVSEYISFITAEANERCQREQRKTVTAEDVLWAMEKLGFDNYAHPLSLYLHRYRESEGEPASVRRASSAMGINNNMVHPPYINSHGFGACCFFTWLVIFKHKHMQVQVQLFSFIYKSFFLSSSHALII